MISQILPWDIFFDLLDKATDGFLVHAGLLRKEFGQLVRVTEGRDESLDRLLVCERGGELADGARVNVHLLQGLGKELLLLSLLQSNQGKKLALVLVEEFPCFVKEIC